MIWIGLIIGVVIVAAVAHHIGYGRGWASGMAVNDSTERGLRVRHEELTKLYSDRQETIWREREKYRLEWQRLKEQMAKLDQAFKEVRGEQ